MKQEYKHLNKATYHNFFLLRLPFFHALAQICFNLWPYSLLLFWVACWSIFLSLRIVFSYPVAESFLFTSFFSLFFSILFLGNIRRLLAFFGFPFSFLILHLSHYFHFSITPLALFSLFLLLFLYPPSLWGQAPIFSTNVDSFDPLSTTLSLNPSDKILDAGCGMGMALKQFSKSFPFNPIYGVEASPFFYLYSKFALRKNASIFFKNFWHFSWQDYRVIYVFLRPDLMQKIWIKFQEEAPSNGYLISCNFPIPEVSFDYQVVINAKTTLYIYKKSFSSIHS